MTWKLHAIQKLFTYALIVIAFLALWLGGTLTLPVGLVCIAVGIVSWYWEPPRIEFSRYASIWMPLTVSMLIALALIAILGLLDPFDAAIGLVLYLALAKLFQRERAADHVQIMVLSFLVMSIATLFNEDISFGFLFILYVIVGLICFSLYHLRIQTELHPQAAAQTRLLGPQFLVTMTGLALIALVGSIAFFFLFPRIGFGFLAQQSQATVMTTGFSEEVDLGDFGTLKSDPTVVMRIEFPDGAPDRPSTLYWRGLSFDLYDGVSWLRTLDRRVFIEPDSQGLVTLYDSPLAERIPMIMTTAQGVEARQTSLSQQIYLEPIVDSSALFGLHPLQAVQLTATTGSISRGERRSFRSERINHLETGDVFRRADRRGGAYQYTAISGLPNWDPNQLRQVSHEIILDRLGSIQSEAYLQLPSNLNPQIGELAETIVQDLDSDYDRAFAIRNYLLSNFSYTIDLPDPGTEPPLDAFLFDFQRGHCEYFSTAMTILLRTVGIPARSVHGFLGGRWNEAEQYLAVRNADAHSWTEIPFGDYGWVPIDATPPAANVSLQTSWTDPLVNVYDGLRFRWTKYVVQYDLETQVDLLQELGKALQEPTSGLRSQNSWSDQVRDLWLQLRANLQQNWIPSLGMAILTAIGGWIGRQRRYQTIRSQDLIQVILLSGVNIGLVISLWQPQADPLILLTAAGSPSLAFALLRWRVWGFRTDRRSYVQGISRLYQQLRQAVTQAGITLKPYQGPAAMIQVLESASLVETDRAIRLIQRYMEVRFGDQSLRPKELQSLWTELRDLQRQWTKPSASHSPARIP